MNISNFFNIPDVSNTIQLVVKKISSVQSCRGQNIVVFIGREEVGKSTTINSLLGTLFQYSEKNERSLEYHSGRKPEAAMGCYERIGLMCTVFPAVYKDTKSDLYFLDTQGFFGTDKDPDEVAAASILLDAAIKSAASVRIIYLEDFNEFSNGLTRINDSINLLNRVILTDDAPIFCLFNRYAPSPKSSKKFYSSDETTQNEIIMKELFNFSETLVISSENNTQTLMQRIQRFRDEHSNNNYNNNSNNNGNDNSNNNSNNGNDNNNNGNNSHIIAHTVQDINEIKAEAEAATKAYNSSRCARIINKNFKEGRYGYIDPTSEWSINNLRDSIMRIPTVNKEKLSFNCCDPKRASFARDFEEILLKHIIPLICDISFSLQFPPNLIEEVQAKLVNSLEKNQHLLSQINEGVDVDVSEISEVSKDLKNQCDQIEKIIEELKSRKDDNDKSIERIRKEKPINYVTYQINEQLGTFEFWTSTKLYYHESLPYVCVDEKLGKGTFAKERINFPTSRFKQTQLEDNRIFFDLIDKENPVNKFEVLYSTGTTVKKVRVAAGGIAAISGIVLGFLGNLELTGTIGGFLKPIVGESYPCTGSVSFFVRYQDKEKSTLNKLNDDKHKLDEIISQKQNEYSQITKALEEDSRNKLTESINQLQINLKEMKEIEHFVHIILEKWNSVDSSNEVFKTVNDEFNAYYQISKMLFSDNIPNESVMNFQKAYDELIKTSPEQDDITSNNIINKYHTRYIHQKLINASLE